MERGCVGNGYHITEETVDEEIRKEQRYGLAKFRRYASMHEAYAVIKEELEEFWNSVKANNPDPEELLHVCATARRALLELCEKRRQEDEAKEESPAQDNTVRVS